MSYVITLSDGSVLTTVYDRTVDNSTSLNLVGRGSVLFGDAVNENIIYLLENFANSAAPSRPIIGQLWFDTSSSLLKVYGGTLAWEPVSDNGSFGLTGQLTQGTLISGSQSGTIRISGTIGVIVNGGLGQTTVAVTLAEGVIISATSNYTIPFLSLPATLSILGNNIPFAGSFPNGLVPGITLATLSYQVSFAGPGIAQVTSSDGSGGVTEEEIQGLITSINGNTASIQQEALTRSTAISALAQTVTNLTASTSSNTSAAVSIEATARANADSALSTQITSLTATVGNNTSSINSEITARANANASLALSIQTLTASVNANQAAVSTETTARVNGDTSLASQITNLSATVLGNTSAITTEQTTRASADDTLAKNAIVISASANRQRVYFQSTAPSGNTDSVWFNTANGNMPYQWNGTTWVPAQDAGVATNAAAITSEQQTRVTNEAAFASQLSSLVTAVNNSISSYESQQSGGSTDYTAFTNAIALLNATTAQNTSAITQEATARSTADATITTTLNSVSSSANRQRVYFQSTPPVGSSDAVWFNLAANNTPYQWTGTIWAPAQDQGIATVAAAVTSEQTSRTTADTALGSRIDALTATVNGVTANVTSEASARATADAVQASTRQALAASSNQTKTYFQGTAPTYATMFPGGVNSHPNCLPATTIGFTATASDSGLSALYVNTTSTPITPAGFSVPVGPNTLFINSVDNRTLANGAVIDTVVQTPPALTPGTIYEFSAYVGTASCSAILILAFLDHNNNTLGSFTSTTVGNGSTINNGMIPGDGSFPGGTSPNAYGRLWVNGTAPAATTSAKLYLRLNGTGASAATLFAQRFYFGQLPAGQTVPSDYTPTSNDRLWLNASDNNQVYTYNLATNVWTAAGDQRIAQNIAAITNESNIRLTNDNSLASLITALTSTVSGNTANITANAQTAATNLAALAATVNTVSSSVGRQRVFFQSTAPIGSTDAVWYNTADGNKPYSWNGTAWVPSQDAGIAANAAAVTAETSARSAADSSLASQITALTATVSGNTASITANATTAANQYSSLASQLTTVSASASAQRVFFGSTPPTGTTDGVWFNAGQNNSPYKWNPTTQTWVSVADAGIGIVAANLATETTARTNGYNTLSQQITNLGSTTNTTTSQISASLSSEISTRSSQYGSLSSSITSLTSTVNSNNSTATSGISTLSSQTSALSSQYSNLSSTVAGHSSSISTLSSSVNGLSASFAVNGYIDGSTGGFVFQGTQRADGTGAVFTTTFNSNVVINGNLLTNGTVGSNKLALQILNCYNTGMGFGTSYTFVTTNWSPTRATFGTSTFDGATFRVGSGEGGLYLVECQLYLNANCANAQISITLNGGSNNVNSVQQGYGGGNYFDTSSIVAFIYTNPGDYIQITYYVQTQNNAGRNFQNYSTLNFVRIQG